MQITTIGLDIAKHVFQVHGVDTQGHPVIKRRLRRSEVRRLLGEWPRCLVGIEACATAHHWARELTSLWHQVRLMQPQYVRPSSSGTRTTKPMRRPSVRRWPGRRCGSCQLRCSGGLSQTVVRVTMSRV
jgi:transposase